MKKKKRFLLSFLLLALTACGGAAERNFTERESMRTDLPMEEGSGQEMEADTAQDTAVPDADWLERVFDGQ